MSIDEQNDLALNAEDAENVVGGQKRTAKKKAAAHKAAGHAASPIMITATVYSSGPVVEEADPNACGPDDPDPTQTT
jgi:hypothetical protein